MKKKIIWIVAAAAAMRIVGLGQPLWLDEAISANVARNLSYSEILHKFGPTDFHPPLYYLILKTWGLATGFGEVALRSFSVIFSLITVFLVYLIGKEVDGQRRGWWAAGLVAANPLLIYYSHEVRMYSLATMWLAAALWAIIKKKCGWYNLFSMLAIWTFYGSIYFLAGVGIYLLIKKKYRLVLVTSMGTVLALVVLGPLISQQIKNSKVATAQVVNWTEVLGKNNLKNITMIGTKMVTGRISFYPKWLYWAVAGLASTVCWGAAIARWREEKFWWGIMIIPVALAAIVSWRLPMMQYFRFIYLVIPMAVILAASKMRMAVILIFGFFGITYLTVDKFHREDWRSLAKEAGEKVVMVAGVSDPIKYYSPQTKVIDLAGFSGGEPTIKLIPYASEIHGIDWQKKMTDLGYKKKDEMHFRGVFWERWEMDN